MLNMQVSEVPTVIKDCIDPRWASNTIFNHYESPLHFMDDINEWEGVFPDGKVPQYIAEGQKKYNEISQLDINYNTLYKDVAKKVKDKLLARGFTTKLLYRSMEFTTQKTGILSKQRALLGKKDCWYKDSGFDDGKLFHDIYINLSYDGDVSDDTITNNSYALYALTRELSKLIAMRVFVVNHVGTNTPICYSYVLKKYGSPISPEQFLFFTSSSKRTFGFAMYDIMNNGYQNIATTGNPGNTVSIASFDLDEQITSIIENIREKDPEKFKDLK